ncbi:hypothetical protein [Microbispora sp. CA-102843]|uniref:hypothetical protein n=1 Tax=Microbispora sp. CA-102843 TaxID=3239952 RepID=UPI003D8C1E74
MILHLANLWPLNLKVQHSSTRRTGTIVACPPRDPIAAELLNGAQAAHAVLRSGAPIVHVDFGDGAPCWYRTTVLRKATDTSAVWRDQPRRWR